MITFLNKELKFNCRNATHLCIGKITVSMWQFVYRQWNTVRILFYEALPLWNSPQRNLSGSQKILQMLKGLLLRYIESVDIKFSLSEASCLVSFGIGKSSLICQCFRNSTSLVISSRTILCLQFFSARNINMNTFLWMLCCTSMEVHW